MRRQARSEKQLEYNTDFLNCLMFVQAQASGWEVTLERQKLRAEALANEFGALVEWAARKVLGQPTILKFRSVCNCTCA